MFGTWLAGLRKQRHLDQSDVATAAGISSDQLSRLESGHNVGVWYAAAALAVLHKARALTAEDEHALISSMSRDGIDIRQLGVLKQRLKTGSRRKPSKRSRHDDHPSEASQKKGR